MTKSELIKLLKPLDNDQEIFAYWDQHCWPIGELLGIAEHRGFLKIVDVDDVRALKVAFNCTGYPYNSEDKL